MNINYLNRGAPISDIVALGIDFVNLLLLTLMPVKHSVLL